jgi:hypothetical protein
MNVQSNLHVQTWLSDIWFRAQSEHSPAWRGRRTGNRSTSFDHFVGSTKH